MQLHLHQTHHTIADFEKIGEKVETLMKSPPEGLHLFPESFLCGYPLQDLVLQRTFIDRYQDFLKHIDKLCQKQFKAKSPTAFLMGGLFYEFDEQGLPLNIDNVIYLATPGEKLKVLYTKKLLPNYDIFDEEKYFSPGKDTVIWEFDQKKIGLLICEDMWVSSAHSVDPVEELFQKAEAENQDLDLIVNLSASPFHLGKNEKRKSRAAQISKQFGAPFVYVNRLGGEDEVLFDGGSFLINGDEILAQGKDFLPDTISHELPPSLNKEPIDKALENTWESLFSPLFDESKPPKLPSLSEEACQKLLAGLSFGIQEYASKSGFKKFLVALSGGIDSALVLAIARLSLQEGQELEAVYMPGFFSSSLSYDLSVEICRNLGVPFKIMPIKFFHSAMRNAYKESFSSEMEGLTDENIQSRLRGSLIYARSNETGAMVLNTSNKSEIAVGYSTLYGDSVGALSVLGDLYKTEVFDLSRYINQKYGMLIPEGIINRPPSAELREDQEDSQSLPPYERLDPILEGFLSYRLGLKDLEERGFDPSEIQKVYGLYTKSEYKRKQFPPIIKLRAKSFGFGYRVPITKKSN